MNLGSLVIDIGNIVFFVATIPQIVNAYRNRKDLKGLSKWMLLGYTAGVACFAFGNFSVGAYIGSFLNIINLGAFLAQTYWKLKYK